MDRKRRTNSPANTSIPNKRYVRWTLNRRSSPFPVDAVRSIHCFLQCIRAIHSTRDSMLAKKTMQRYHVRRTPWNIQKRSEESAVQSPVNPTANLSQGLLPNPQITAYQGCKKNGDRPKSASTSRNRFQSELMPLSPFVVTTARHHSCDHRERTMTALPCTTQCVGIASAMSHPSMRSPLAVDGLLLCNHKQRQKLLLRPRSHSCGVSITEPVWARHRSSNDRRPQSFRRYLASSSSGSRR